MEVVNIRFGVRRRQRRTTSTVMPCLLLFPTQLAECPEWESAKPVEEPAPAAEGAAAGGKGGKRKAGEGAGAGRGKKAK